jgi:SMI1 / KNR4 family (SUKH-1)
MYTWLPKKIEQAQAILSSKDITMGFKLNSPASLGEIQQCEDRLSLTLPKSFKEFLKFANGAHIFCGESTRGSTESWWAGTGILIQSTSSIVSFNQHVDQVYLEDGEKKYIAFCYLGYIGTGDFCGFDVTSYIDSECKVLDCYHDCSFEDWHESHVIADSFEDWLIKVFDEVIINKNRPEYWLPTPLEGG